ncbi:MAG TPA: hypothetical protein VKZ18_15785 [Polyangia bacterium]|nr:hypothetical protein [Polyangia bacterium]
MLVVVLVLLLVVVVLVGMVELVELPLRHSPLVGSHAPPGHGGRSHAAGFESCVAPTAMPQVMQSTTLVHNPPMPTPHWAHAAKKGASHAPDWSDQMQALATQCWS